MRRALYLLYSAVLCNLLTGVVPAGDWKAGVGRAVITPPSMMWMSGYASRDRPAQGKLHDLSVKALLLQDQGGNRCLALTYDLVGIDRRTSQEICRQLEAAFQLRREQIAICTSHTHSGPVVGRNLLSMYELDERQLTLVHEYTDFLAERTLEAARSAVESLAECEIHVGEGTSDFAVNRRNNREADVPMLREQGQLVGPVDHSVPVLVVRTPAGIIRAILFGYACHATVLSGMDWCGDWPGYAQIEIEKRHPGVTALFWAGCGADQNPLPRRTVELAQKYGGMAADAVDGALQQEMQSVQGQLKTVYSEIPLRLGQLPDADQIRADADSSNVYLVRRARVLQEQLQQQGQLSSTYPYPLQVWQVGDAATLTFLGGEVVVDYSLRLKRELAAGRHWIAGYSNDVMAYIPSLRVLREGGYEGASSMIYYGLPTVWSGDVEEQVVEGVLQLHQQLQSQP
jgi:neutral ceramidase